LRERREEREKGREERVFAIEEEIVIAK